MTDLAAIQGNYADFKLVKTRSVCQLVIEIPIERAEQAIKAFGIPQPGSEIAVAVAKLAPGSVQTTETQEKTSKHEPPRERSRAEWAGIRCNDPMFRRWLYNLIGADVSTALVRSFDGMSTTDDQIAAAALRRHINIQSRKELDSNPAKAAAWDELQNRFIEDTRLPERH